MLKGELEEGCNERSTVPASGQRVAHPRVCTDDRELMCPSSQASIKRLSPDNSWEECGSCVAAVYGCQCAGEESA